MKLHSTSLSLHSPNLTKIPKSPNPIPPHPHPHQTSLTLSAYISAFAPHQIQSLACRRPVSLKVRPVLPPSSFAGACCRVPLSLPANLPKLLTPPPPSFVEGTNGNLGQTSTAEPSSTVTTLPTTQKESVLAAGQQAGSSKSRVAATKKPSTKSTLSPDSMVKAAAVAAGARIATPSDAATLLMAAQSKNAVHIIPGGSLLKS